MVTYEIHDIATRLAVHNAKLKPPVLDTAEGKKEIEETAKAIGVLPERLIEFHHDVSTMTPPATW